MGDLHIYRASMQPATCWVDNNGPEPFEVRWPAHSLLWCLCCHQKRLAKNCVVQAYYDCVMCWCAPGKGCKDPKVIAAKARREFRNRSAGQKRRWRKA